MKKLKQMYRCMEERMYRNGKTTGCPTKTFGHDRRCGFTLVELVIVIAIVIILSVVSVPIYRGYVDKAKWSEVYALTGTILSAQKSYYSEYGNFLIYADGVGGWTNYDTILGIDTRGNKYFTYFKASIYSDSKNCFKARIMLPIELQRNDKDRLAFNYNISTGAEFKEINSND